MNAALEREVRPDPWVAFTAAGSVESFCQAWLQIQIQTLGEVRRAMVLLRGADGSYAPVAYWPSAQTDLTDLAEPAKRCLASRAALVEASAEPSPGLLTVGYPLDLRGQVHGVIVLEMPRRGAQPVQVQQVLRGLHWGVGWIDAMLRGQEVEQLGAATQRAEQVVDALLRIAEAADLDAAAHLLVDALSERLGLVRASLGLVDEKRSARLRLAALSATAWFDRRSALAVTIENTMEEAWDQRASVASPPVAGMPAAVDVAHAELAAQSGGASAVLSAVVSAGGRPIGVLLVERSVQQPFTPDDVLRLQAWARAVGPVLAMHRDAHRWIAGRLRRKLHAARLVLTDTRRPAWRLGAVVALLLLVGLAFVDTDYRVNARAVIEGSVQRATIAPFDGYVREARVKAGHVVKAGDVMATLDDRELRLEQERWASEERQHERRYRDALARHERAAARIAAAERAQAQAQLVLVEERLARTELRAPFDGVVVSGDLSQLLGSPVERGKLLFEVAPLQSFRVVLKVDDTDIRGVQVGQSGRLVLAGLADRTLGFTVKNIAVAGAEDGRNVFEVEAQLAEAPPQLRPGMEGVGKIEAGERRLLWIWTHRFTDWLRLKAWEWWP